MRGGSLYWLSLILGKQFKSATHKMVMLVLADYVDENDSCFPSQATISGQAQASSRKCWSVLKELEESGCIIRERRSTDGGYRTSDRITLRRGGVEGLPDVQYARRASRSPSPNRTDEHDLTAPADATYPHAGCGAEPPIEPPIEGVVDQRSTTREPDAEVVELCEYLADRIAAWRGTGNRPKVGAAWHTDMRLLMERGPAKITPTRALSAETIRMAIDTVFTELNEPEGNGTFCWAKNVQSPGTLRTYWERMSAEAANKRRGRINKNTRNVMRTAMRPAEPSDAARLFRGELGAPQAKEIS